MTDEHDNTTGSAHESLRRRAGFKKHLHQAWPGQQRTRPLELVIHEDEHGWLKKASRAIPGWRDDVRDVYLRWAITVNAMYVAAEHYDQHPELGLKTRTIRADRLGNGRDEILETWSSSDTARNYRLASPLIAAYAVADLFGLMEEIIFELYLLYLNERPEALLKGPDFRGLRLLRRNQDSNPRAKTDWENAWAQRLSSWRERRSYDGLHRVFAQFMNETGMKRPSFHTITDVEDWVATIEAIGEARNLITHGVGTVSDRLAVLSEPLKNDVFRFKSGDALEVDFRHASFVEFFLDGLLTALSFSLLERAYGKLPMSEPYA